MIKRHFKDGNFSLIFLIGIPLFFLIIFFYVPVITIIKESFITETGISIKNFTAILTDSFHTHVIIFTLWQALLSSLLTIIIAFPAAYIFANFQFPFKRTFMSISLIPFVLPSIIVALGFILFWGNNGFLNRFLSLYNLKLRVLYSFKAILLAHVFYNFPIAMRMITQSWQNIDKNVINSARVLGANKFTVFRKIVFPSLLPAIVNSGILIFLYCFMSFGIVLILGGIQYSTIEVNIYMLVNNLMKIKLGSALGVIQIFLSLIFLQISIKINKDKIDFLKLQNQFSEKIETRFSEIKFHKRLLISAYLFLIILIIVGPIFSIIFYSLFYTGLQLHPFSLENFQKILANNYDPILGNATLEPVLNSLIIAFSCGVISIFLAIMISVGLKKIKKNNFIEILVLLPMGVSSVTFSLGYIKIIRSGFMYLSSYQLLICAHVVIVFPLVFRIVFHAFKNLNQDAINAARILGSNKIRLFVKIIFPEIKSTLFLAFTFAFALSMGEMGASAMLAKDFNTIPVAMYRYIGAHDFNKATAMGVMLIFISAILFVFFNNKGESSHLGYILKMRWLFPKNEKFKN